MKNAIFNLIKTLGILSIVYILIASIFWLSMENNSIKPNTNLSQNLYAVGVSLLPTIATNQNLVPNFLALELSSKDIDSQVKPLILKGKSQEFNLSNFFWYQKEFALVYPEKNTANRWSLVWCEENDCFESSIYLSQKIRLKTSPKDRKFWGKDTNGKYFELNLEGYFSGNDYNFYLLV